MSDLELLFVVLVGLYAWECSCWLRRGSVAFVSWLGPRSKIIHPGPTLGNQRGSLIFAPPLPPLGTLLTGTQFPLSISGDALLAFISTAINPAGRPQQSGKLIRFDDIRELGRDGKKLLVNGQRLLACPTPTYAEWLVQQLRPMLKMTAAQRVKAIEELARGCFDTRKLETRWKEYEQRTREIRIFTNFLFVYLFVLAPVFLWQFGLHQSWMGLVAGLFLLTISNAFYFRSAHKYFYPSAGEERFTHFLTIMLAPATSIRARDVVSRPLLETFHPLAIAKVFCSEQDFRAFAERTLREMLHPGRPLYPGQEPLAKPTEQSARDLLRANIERFLKQNGVKPETLIRTPKPADENCRSYCPRCLAQFTTPAGTCLDCGGVELARFEVLKPAAKGG